MISINDAVKLGNQRLRKPIWSNPLDHLKIDIIDGQLGPWIHMFSPLNKECNGRDPVDILIIMFENLDSPEFEIYEGPLPDSEEYKAAVAWYDGLYGKTSNSSTC